MRGFEPVRFEYLKHTNDYSFKGIDWDNMPIMRLDNILFYQPIRKTAGSAGYDFKSVISKTISPKSIEVFWSNVKAYMQLDEVLEIHIRSSIAFKKGLRLVNVVGIIDADYYSNPDNDGNIGIGLYNPTDKPVEIEAGERIAQGIFKKYLVSDNGNEGGVRAGGFGSTGA